MKKLQRVLLTYYLFGLAAIEGKSLHDTMDILSELSLDYGVCYASATEFGKRIAKQRWVQAHLEHERVWWGDYPQCCAVDTLAKVKQALQLRIDILTKIVGEDKA